MRDSEPSIEKLAALSLIKISEHEKEILKKEIEILNKLIKKIMSAPNIDNMPPLYHPLDVEGAKREDKVSLVKSQKNWAQSALEVEDGFIKAPRTLEE